MIAIRGPRSPARAAGVRAACRRHKLPQRHPTPAQSHVVRFVPESFARPVPRLRLQAPIPPGATEGVFAVRAENVSRPIATSSKQAVNPSAHRDLIELQQALMEEWKLPEFLIQISGDGLAQHASGQCVSLGVRVARHTALGWDNAAIPDDVSDVSKLLNLSPSSALSLLRSLDV